MDKLRIWVCAFSHPSSLLVCFKCFGPSPSDMIHVLLHVQSNNLDSMKYGAVSIHTILKYVRWSFTRFPLIVTPPILVDFIAQMVSYRKCVSPLDSLLMFEKQWSGYSPILGSSLQFSHCWVDDDISFTCNQTYYLQICHACF